MEMMGKQAPDMREVYRIYESALFFYSNGDYHNAVIQLKTLLNLNPEFKEAWELLGNCYKAIGDIDAAQHCFQQSQKLAYAGPLTAYCPFCGTVVGENDSRCRSCGVSIVESPEEKARHRGFVLTRAELKVVGRVEIPQGQETTVRSGYENQALPETQGPTQTHSFEKRMELNGRESQPPYTFPDLSLKTASRFGFADSNGLTFGRKKIKGFSPKVYIVPFIFLAFILISILSGLYNLSTKPLMKVDGVFEEWENVDKASQLTAHAQINPNIRIKEFSFAEKDEAYFVYLSVEGRILTGSQDRKADTIFVFIDTGTRGFSISGIGASYHVQVYGWNNEVYSTTLYRYDGDAFSWQWIQPISIPAAVSEKQLEIEIKKSLLSGSDFKIFIAIQGYDGTLDMADYPIGKKPTLLLTTRTLLQDITQSGDVEAMELEFTAARGKVELKEVIVSVEGTAAPQTATLKGAETLNVGIEGGKYSFHFVRILDVGRSEKWRLIVPVDASMSSATLGFSVGAEGIRADAIVVLKEGSDRFHAKKSYVVSAPEVTIDGAFADWASTQKRGEAEGEVSNPSIDIHEFAVLRRTNNLAFYLDVERYIFSGEKLPYRNYVTVGNIYSPDTDRDTIPDSIDPMPSDFNNDGIPDAQTNNDVDGDKIKDYPYGEDYYLNTTIPDNTEFPSEYRGKFVSVYIGPTKPTQREIRGFDWLRIYLDTDNNRSTGLPSASIGADYLIEFGGREGRIIDKIIWMAENGEWRETNEWLSGATDFYRIEFEMVKSFQSNPDVYIEFSDFWHTKDTALFEHTLSETVRGTECSFVSMEQRKTVNPIDGEQSALEELAVELNSQRVYSSCSEKLEPAEAIVPESRFSSSIPAGTLSSYLNASKEKPVRHGFALRPASSMSIFGAPGSGWIPDINVSKASNYDAFSPVMATDSDNYIYTAFMFWSTAVSRWGIAVFRSTDSGLTWSGLWWYFTNYDCDWPSLAISGSSGSYANRIYLAFALYSSSYMFIEVGYVDKANFATSTAWQWKQITSASEYWDMPSITVMGNSVNSVYIAARWWYGNFDRDILGFRSDNGGTTWNGLSPPLTSNNAYQIRYTYEDSGVVYGPTVAWGTGTNLYCAYDDMGITAARWEFWTNGNAEGWTVGNHLTAFTVSGGILTTTATGNDPYMYSPALSISAANYRYIHLYMRATGTGTTTKIYFITSTDGTWNEAKSVTLSVTDHSNYVWYTFNMSQCPYWSGTVTRLRLDPIDVGAQSGDIYYIDMISIQSRPLNSLVWKSSDNGVTWNTGFILRPAGPDVTPSFAPYVAATHGSNTVVVASVYYKSSTDWDINISYSTDGLASMYIMAFSTETTTQAWPALCSDPVYGYFHLVYYDSGSYSIRYAKAYYTTPNSWSVPYATGYVSDGSTGDWEYRPAVTYQWRDGGASYYPCVTWGDKRGSYWNVYYSTPGSRCTITTSPAGLLIEVDSTQYTAPVSFTWLAGYNHYLYAPSPQGTDIYAPRYVFSSWSDGGAQGHTITVLGFDMTITAYYQTQYYLRVISAYGSPTGEGWYNAGSSASASVNSPVSGGPGAQYACTGYTGTGSAPSGTGTSVSFAIYAPSSVTFNWKTQYLLTVTTINVTSTYPVSLLLNGSFYSTIYDGLSIDLWLDANLGYQIGVSSEVSGPANTRWAFWRWTSGSGMNPITVNLNAPSQMTAEFLKQYYCTLSLYGLSPSAPATINYQSFLNPSSVYSSDTWNAWIDHGSTITVSNEIYVSSTERYRTVDQYSFVAITGPISRTITYRHQWFCTITLSGTDASHTVWANYTLDGVYYSQSGVHGSWSSWCDHGTTLSFSDTTTGSPPYTTTDPHSWAVTNAMVATIHYSSSVEEATNFSLYSLVVAITFLFFFYRRKLVI